MVSFERSAQMRECGDVGIGVANRAYTEMLDLLLSIVLET